MKRTRARRGIPWPHAPDNAGLIGFDLHLSPIEPHGFRETTDFERKGCIESVVALNLWGQPVILAA